MNELREKKKALATEQDRQKKEAEKIRKGLKNLQTAVSNVEVILDTKSVPERRNQELQVQKKKSYRGQELSWSNETVKDQQTKGDSCSYT